MVEKYIKEVAQALKDIHDITAIEIATSVTSNPVLEEVFRKASVNWLSAIKILNS